MHISQIQVENFRNLENQIFQLSPNINLITGDNGAGKTSLLEAIYFLGRQRSFRTAKSKEIVKKNKNYFRIIAKTEKPNHQIGLEREINKNKLDFRCRIDKKEQKSPNKLIKTIPTIAITAQSFQLIDSGPIFRRSFMDYGAFYSDTNFFKHWQSYKKSLKNRNSAFKKNMGKIVIDSFTPTLSKAGEEIHKIRKSYFNEFKILLNKYLNNINFPFKLNIRYLKGWGENEVLYKTLERNFEIDKKLNHTRLGPHRADINFSIDGGNAENRLSRGQQKSLILAMYLAQIEFIGKFSMSAPLLIFDDIAAEFDSNKRNQILDYLSKFNCQMFFSTTEPDFFENNIRDKANLILLNTGKVVS